MKLFLYLSIIGAILSDVVYHFSEKNIPKNINPLFSLAVVYLISSVLTLIILLISGKKVSIIKELSTSKYSIVFLSISIIIVELSYLLAYRVGGELSKLYNIVTPLQSTILVLVGVIFYSEKVNSKIVTGIIFAMTGITMLSM